MAADDAQAGNKLKRGAHEHHNKNKRNQAEDNHRECNRHQFPDGASGKAVRRSRNPRNDARRPAGQDCRNEHNDAQGIGEMRFNRRGKKTFVKTGSVKVRKGAVKQALTTRRA